RRHRDLLDRYLLQFTQQTALRVGIDGGDTAGAEVIQPGKQRDRPAAGVFRGGEELEMTPSAEDGLDTPAGRFAAQWGRSKVLVCQFADPPGGDGRDDPNGSGAGVNGIVVDL